MCIQKYMTGQGKNEELEVMFDHIRISDKTSVFYPAILMVKQTGVAGPRQIDKERRTRRIHSSGSGKRGEIGERLHFFFLSRHPPRLVSISALPSAPSDESTSHHQCQYRLGYLVERTTMGEARGRTRGC